MQNLLQDEAYPLQSRGVVKLEGEDALEALQSLCSNSLANVNSKAVLSYILDEENYLLADVFVVSHDGGLLVECEKTFIAPLLELLSLYCDGADLSAIDCSDQWRVLAEGPDQSTFKEGGAYIKYVDPRWHMGARLLRPASDAPSYHWGSELKWSTRCPCRQSLGYHTSGGKLALPAITGCRLCRYSPGETIGRAHLRYRSPGTAPAN